MKNKLAWQFLGLGVAALAGYVFWSYSGDRVSGVRPGYINSNWCFVQKEKGNWGDDFVYASISKDGFFDPKAKVIKFRSTASIVPLPFFTGFWIPEDVSVAKPAALVGSANSSLVSQEPRISILQKGDFCKLR
jgi:hypothetical protein